MPITPNYPNPPELVAIELDEYQGADVIELDYLLTHLDDDNRLDGTTVLAIAGQSVADYLAHEVTR